MTNFTKSNIKPEWQDLVDEFPDFIFDLSPYLRMLISEHPVMFGTTDIIVNLRMGFEYDKGWKQLTREHFNKLRGLIRIAKSEGHDINYRPFILKEKLGGFRDQGQFFGEDIKEYQQSYDEIVRQSYAKSTKTCEVTGEEGFLCHSNTGWYKTLSKKMIDNNYNDMEWAIV